MSRYKIILVHKTVDIGQKDKYSERMKMKELTKEHALAIIAFAPALAYVGYKLALELWCIAYGLIY